MNTHDHDELPGDDELKALYRNLPRKEPSPALDAAVKRAAADAVRPARHSFTRWPVAVASTTMMIAAAGLGWRMMQQPASVPQVPTHAVVTQSAPTANAKEEPTPAPAPQAAPAASRLPTIASADARVSTPAPAKRESIRSAMKPKIVAPTVATEQAPVVSAEQAPMTAPSADAAAVATAPAAPPPPPAPSVEESVAAGPMAAPTAKSISAQAFRASPAMKTMAAPAPATMLALDATAPAATDSPTQELDNIRLLLAQQHHDEAVQRLLAFRKRHPDITLPDDLRALLPDHE